MSKPKRQLKIKELKEYEVRDFLSSEGAVLITKNPPDFGSVLVGFLYDVGATKVTVASTSIHSREDSIYAISLRVYCTADEEDKIISNLELNDDLCPDAAWRMPGEGGLRCLELWWN